MNRFITYFLPKEIEQADQDTRSKTIYMVFALITISCSSLSTIFLFVIYNMNELLHFTLLMLASAIGMLLFHKQSNQTLITSYLFATFSATYMFTIVYYTGGINSSFLIWIMMLPIVSTMIALRVGLIYYGTFLGLVVYIFFLILGEQSSEIFNLIPPTFASTYSIINQIVIMLSAISILTFYFHQNKSYNKQLKEANRQLAESNKSLEESNKNLEQFAYIASHDMKAPLRSIVSFSQLLKRKLLRAGNTAALEYLGFIERNGKKMGNLIQGILDFSTVQTKTKIKTETIDLNELMKDIMLSLQGEIEEKNAILDVSDLPTVQANELQLAQVFQNLISNGLKYNRSETPTIKIRCQREEKCFEFFVEDNGIGMKEEYFNKIFKMFERLNSSAEFEGTGIGLAICKKIALLHNGDLVVLKSSDTGTTFRFTLPL